MSGYDLARLEASLLEAVQADDRPEMLRRSDALLACDPTSAKGLFSAGMAMFREERHGLASVLLNAASHQLPEDPSVWNNLGCALERWQPAGALTCMETALHLDPTFDAALANMVGVLQELGKFDEAIKRGREYLADHPDDPDCNHNVSLALMQVGRWREAWGPMRKALGHRRGKERLYGDLPRWTGEGDATVVIYGEQGLGDEILGAAFYDHVAATGARVIIDCEPRLEGLFRRSFPSFDVFGTLLEPEESLGWVDVLQPTHRIECLGLGELFAPEPFRRGPYLKTDPAKRAMFRAWLDAIGPGLKVGLSWRAGVKPWDRAQRCIPESVLPPLLATTGVQFIDLNWDGGPTDGVHLLPWAVRKGADFDDTAALVAGLDLIISVPQTVVDAAGAIGTPCWALTPPVPQYRFAEAAGDEAWFYQGVEIFRRKGPQWAPVILRAAQRLRMLAPAEMRVAAE